MYHDCCSCPCGHGVAGRDQRNGTVSLLHRQAGRWSGQSADAFFTATEADIRHGGGKAYYSGSTDHVQMSVFESFVSPEADYAILAHELTRWTKHKRRLDRDFERKAWGDEVEEVTA
ncbi:zincin-like metallopeptidase domain-containing protein [Pararhodobacter sp. CCB-MM2]|uniref:zincin-like metallopeptidase domain-containing protein n=1 Tax=Pararhodobacter sp. CCB-MM2 TaxID=1786003 RepID=UPI001314EDE6|nr:zincin-like metallopeptidase domain-containing protein [Pararhodobacter sp. CCB-MM2]